MRSKRIGVLEVVAVSLSEILSFVNTAMVRRRWDGSSLVVSVPPAVDFLVPSLLQRKQQPPPSIEDKLGRFLASCNVEKQEGCNTSASFFVVV
jgi:hypothetical protein